MPDPEPMPFERLPGESKQAYEAACLYFDTPPGEGRSLRRVGQALGKSGSLISRWSAVWDWPERAGAWDRLVEAQARQQKQDAHVAALLTYQKRLNERAKTVTSMVGGLSNITGLEIARRLKTPETLSGAELAALVRAIAALTDTALFLEGVGLSIPQLLSVYNETAHPKR